MAAVVVTATPREGAAWSHKASRSLIQPTEAERADVEPVQFLGQDKAHQEETSPLKSPCPAVPDDTQPSLVSPTLVSFEVQAAPLVPGASPSLQDGEVVSAPAYPREDAALTAAATDVPSDAHGQADSDAPDDNSPAVV